MVEAGDAEDEQGAADVGQAQHPVRVEAIHGAAQEECAEGAAELEHGADRRRLAETEAGAADQRRQPVGQQVDDQQAHEKGGPEQQGAAAQLGAEDLPQGRGAVGLVGGQFEASGPAVGQAPQAFEDAPQARRVRCAAGEEAHRLRQACPEQRQARQGQAAAEQQHAFPAQRRDHPRGEQAAQRRAEGEAAEHRGDHQRAVPARAVFGGQGDRVGHRPAQAEAGEKAQQGQGFHRTGVGRGKAPAAEEQHREQEHALTSETVGQRAGGEGAEGQAGQRGAEDRAELRRAQLPVVGQGRGDEADGGGVESVHGDDQEAQRQDSQLEGGNRLRIDESLDVDLVVLVGRRHERSSAVAAATARMKGRVGPRRARAVGQTTRTLSSPRPSMAPSIRSPRSTAPTPSGVPVKTRSPGRSSKKRDR